MIGLPSVKFTFVGGGGRRACLNHFRLAMDELLNGSVESIDCVEYNVYNLRSDAPLGGFSSALPPEVLQAIAREFTAYLQASFIQDYLWQDESFQLLIGDQSIPHLTGRTTFGQNLEDEWFIIFLLYNLSIKYPHCVIRYVYLRPMTSPR